MEDRIKGRAYSSSKADNVVCKVRLCKGTTICEKENGFYEPGSPGSHRLKKSGNVAQI